ncbi:MAG TPA: tyrosine-protein phosphatase [Blastocatellia bacterium]|nr:tyrosine-protein phosphatase [Blastocatellia bacterium]HMX27906.1 tyrosine-protein phosphatase [Blastocatellia bacterium]HMZ20853.1 tyrosine-protein phosphatase [Blastocatellia bacterium]HNG30899.1 tyrosine-protein phosphatase [Blastocatellia bacterium]
MSSTKRISRLHQVFSPNTKKIAGRAFLFVMIAVAVFSVTSVSRANSKDKDEKKSTTDAGVSNFGKVEDFYYRGAQPKEDEYERLAALGIKTIIDLRDDPKDYAKTKAEYAGMKYINLPMSDKEYPSADAADKFLSMVNDKANWPVYVHCAGGRHRTGAMTAVFRMKMQGWDVDQAYDEMKGYDFYTRWGHKAMKTFVFDYYRGLVQRGEYQKNQVAESAVQFVEKNN